MKRLTTILFLLFAFAASDVLASVSVELRGSPASMERQNRYALEAEYTFARTLEDIDRMLETGDLVMLTGDENYDLREGMTSDAARPEMRLFVERLAAEYHEATGEKLVVTSLTRPSSMQPGNSHSLSVHPTGMALDLRISQQQASRAWLEERLLGLEADGILDVTRERHPPHYHIALFTGPFLAYMEDVMGPEALKLALSGAEAEAEEEAIQEVAEEDAAPRLSIWGRLVAMLLR
jgi:hypothetical protein